MSETRTCPTCNTPLPADAPDGGCPRCLLIAGLQSHAGSGGGGSATTAPSPADLAAYFPTLEILELIGQGGMGIVYKARQKGLDRFVALKILAPEMAADAAFSDRFTREAQALARLSHPNIVGVHEFGETEGLYYFVMEYVDGMNLREALHGEHLKATEALAIVPQICDALQFAHDNGVVHRDIKPENVLIGKDGRVKIADFGLAKLLSRVPEEFTLTRAGQVMGTPHYMAPEQIESPAAVDHRADIYSLGVVFYEMLTGELPLGRFQPPSRRVQIDVRLDDVVLRALEKAPDRRYQQVSEVKTRVNGLGPPPAASAAPPAAVPPPVAAQDGARGRLSRLALAGFLCFPASTLALVLGGVLTFRAAGGTGTSVRLWMMMALGLVPVAVALAGLVLSISGWVAINRSNGRLHGKAFAILGTFLPLLCAPVGVGWMSLGAVRTAGPSVAMASAEQGTPSHHEAIMRSLAAAADGDLDAEGVLALTAWDDAEKIRRMTPEQRDARAAEGLLGPLFFLLAHEGESFEVNSLETRSDGGGSVQVTTRDGQLIEFDLVREGDGEWYFSGGPLDR